MSSRRTAGPFGFRLARVVNVGIDDLLAGRFPEPGVCPRCAYRLPLNGDYRTPRATRSASRTNGAAS